MDNATAPADKPADPIAAASAAALRARLEALEMTWGQFARLAGVSRAMVGHWLAGKKRISGERCAEIERRSSGAIRRAQLRPDLFGKDITGAGTAAASSDAA